MNDPLCLENSFWNLASISLVFNEDKIQEQIGGHVVSKCKKDKFEGMSVTNFGFMEDSFDFPWPLIYWKKGKIIKGLSVGVLELYSFMFRKG